MSPIAIVVVAIVVCMLLGRKGRKCSPEHPSRHSGFSWPTRMLGFAAILGGVWMFCAPRAVHHEMVHVDLDRDGAETHVSHDRDDEDGDWNIGASPLERDWRFGHGHPELRHLSHEGMPRWGTIALATMLIITGAMLAGRERTRPRAFTALTVLGIAAILYTVVSFFQAVPQTKVVVSPRAVAVRRDVDGHSSTTTVTTTVNGRPASRARRPASRPLRPTDADAPLEMPPRAGEIPVEAELAATPQTQTAAAQTAPAQPAPPAPQSPAPQSQVPLSTVPAATTTEQIAVAPAVEAQPAPPATSTITEATPAAAQVAPEKEATTPPVAQNTPAPPASAPTAQAPSGPVPQAQAPSPKRPATETPTSQPPTQPARIAKVPAVRATETRRPDWVDPHAKLANTMVAVKSGLWTTMPECQRKLDQEIQREADHYIELYLGEGAAQHVHVSLDYLKKHVQQAEYAEVVESESVGPMHQVHALLDFNDQTRADFHHLYDSALVNERLWYAGSGAALILVLLGTLYGYLKLGQRTDQVHRGRLQLAATLLALILAAGALLARYSVL